VDIRQTQTRRRKDVCVGASLVSQGRASQSSPLYLNQSSSFTTRWMGRWRVWRLVEGVRCAGTFESGNRAEDYERGSNLRWAKWDGFGGERMSYQ